MKKVVGTEVTIFVYDAGGQMVAEYATTAPSALQVNYLTADTLGTPRINTDVSGSVIARHDYLPFGEEISGYGARSVGTCYNGDSIRHKFTRKELDKERGLDYFGARYLAVTHGRFTSPDPLHASERTFMPQSWNRYSYVLNNPQKLIDPTGLVDDDPRQVKTEQQQQPPQPDQSQKPTVSLPTSPTGVSGPYLTATLVNTAAYYNASAIAGPSGDPVKTPDGKTATYGFEAKLEYTVKNVDNDVKVESATETLTTTVNGVAQSSKPPITTAVKDGKYPDTLGITTVQNKNLGSG